MVSKQKSIFDKAVVAQQKKEKVREELIPFEDSVFAKYKKSSVVEYHEPTVAKGDFVPIEDTIFYHNSFENNNIYVDNEDTDFKDSKNNEFMVHDDEVPFEESIFAKKKKSSSFAFKAEKKINPEDLFNKYKDIYTLEYIMNADRMNIIDSDLFDRCCVLLEESRNTKIMNIESYDIIKRVIKSSCTCIEDVFYSYTNMNSTLISLIFELNPELDTFKIYNVLDKSYAEVIDEFRGVHGENS